MTNSVDDLSPSKTRQILSWILVMIVVAVFLPSLPFKFSGAPETQHIFGTIGKWMSGFLGGPAETFNFGADIETLLYHNNVRPN